MMGIRRKVILGFAGIALLLFCSGMFALFELNRLSHTTQSLLDSSSRNIEISRAMLDAVQDQNTALLQMIVLNNNNYDSLYKAGKANFDKALEQATVTVGDLADLDSIYRSCNDYDQIVNDYVYASPEQSIDWFMNVYKTSYFKLTASIKNYMSSSQHSLNIKASQLEKNAYRTITPNVITLGVLVMIIAMFLFFVDLYVLKPIVNLNKSVGGYVNNRIPFNVKIESKDELLSLKENIEKLILAIKNKKND